MASHDLVYTPLTALPRGRLGELASLLPQPSSALQISIVEPLRVLSLRCLPGGAELIARTAGIAELPGPGRFLGQDPLLQWRSPNEWLHISTRDEEANALLRALPIGGLAQATDLSAGTLLLDLQGTALDALLERLIDATVQVDMPGQGTRTRMADIAVMLIRQSKQRLWLLADRANDHYLAHWLAYASTSSS